MPDTADPAHDWTGRPCPKCGYVRTPLHLNPAWQCPQCQVAYAKAFAPRPELPVHERFFAHAGAMTTRAASDHSLAGLFVANAFALTVALATGMSVAELMLAYWMQSVVIGLSNAVRIVKLHDYSVNGTLASSQTEQKQEALKYETAIFFLAHYGFFHLGYLVFILNQGGLGNPWGYAACGLAFAVNHFYSLRHNLASDAAGCPSIGAMMFMPYARILPMTAMVVSGQLFGRGPAETILIFGGLKTLADLIMHTVEHYALGNDEGG
jgi:hypothetical protein